MTASVRVSGTVHRRMFAAMAGSGLSLASRIVLQVAQVPLFLWFWSPERYGEWLILFSIPAYLALADFGMGEAGANFIARAVAAGDERRARAIHSAVRLFITSANLLLLGIAAIAIFGLRLQASFGFEQITGEELEIAIAALCLGVLFSLQAGTSFAALRGIGRYSDQQVITSVVGIAEFIAIAAALAIAPTAAAIGGAIAVVRLLTLVGLQVHVRRHAAALVRLDLTAVGGNLRMLIGPSLGFMGFPVAGALLIQGYNLLIGLALGPAALVVYTACATAARALQAAMVAVYSILAPEAAILIGKGKIRFLRNLHRAASAGIVPVLPFLGAGLYLLTVLFFPSWVQNRVEVDHAALAVLIAINVVKIAYYPSFAMLSAFNSHKTFAALWLSSAVASIIVSALLTRATDSIAVLLLPILATEALLFLFSTRKALRLLGDRPSNVIRRGPGEARRFARLSWKRLRPSSAGSA